MSDCRMVWVMAGSRDEALAIGRAVVERRLAACANVLGPAATVYWWRGALETAEETVLVLKTVAANVTNLIDAIRSLHSYDCPAVSVLPIEAGNPDYLAWIAAEAAPQDA